MATAANKTHIEMGTTDTEDLIMLYLDIAPFAPPWLEPLRRPVPS